MSTSTPAAKKARSSSGAPSARSPSLPAISPGRDPSSSHTAATPLNSIAEEVEEAEAGQRVSFYVQAADEMLEATLEKEAFLFTRVEQAALRRFQELDYQARYLFMRLYLRKHGWIRLDSLGYENDISHLDTAYETLCTTIDLSSPCPPKAESSTPKELDPNVVDLTGDDDDDEAADPDEAEELDFRKMADGKNVLAEAKPEEILGVLSRDELEELGKRSKINGGKGTRREWTTALLKTASQSTLGFFATPKGKGKEDKKMVGMHDEKGNKLKQSSLVVSSALKTIGSCIRIHRSYVSLFNRLSLVYHRTAYTSSTGATSLTASLLSRFGKRHYPSYGVSRSFSIFPSRSILRQFEEALEVEQRMEELLEGNGGQRTKDVAGAAAVKKEREEGWAEGIKLFEEKVKSPWEKMCEEGKREMKQEKKVPEEKQLLYYRKRFHPGWPLTRAVYKAAAIYARLNQHASELPLLRALLAQQSFRRGKRGDWFDRLALVLMKYPSAEEEDERTSTGKQARLAKKRKEEALEVCLAGLADPYTHLIYKSSLQRRVSRVESALEVPKSQRHTFERALSKSESRIEEAERLDDPVVGKKSVWKGEDDGEISVEELALERYAAEGWKGFHSENSILTTIFSLVFWDILFAPIDGVFETAYQSAPLDLRTDAFCIVRRSLIKSRIASVEKGKAKSLLSKVDDRERPKNTFCVGVNWDKYSKQDLVEIVECIGSSALASILAIFAEEYGHRTGGIPDLCLWKPDEDVCKFVEVKGPGDSLSETQKVWIDVLLTAGVEVEVCHVMTPEERLEMLEKQKERKEKAGKRGKKRARTEEDDEDFSLSLDHWSIPTQPDLPQPSHLQHTMVSFTSSISSFIQSIFQIFEGILHSILAVFESIFAVFQTILSQILGLVESVFKFVIDNVVILGVAAAVLVAYLMYTQSQGRAGGLKKRA